MLPKRPECRANPRWFLCILNINILQQGLNKLPVFALFIRTDWGSAAFTRHLHRKPIKQLLQGAAAVFETLKKKRRAQYSSSEVVSLLPLLCKSS